MTIYEHRASVTAVAGSVASVTLTVPGGLCRQVLIRSATSLATIFRADLTDANGTVRVQASYSAIQSRPMLARDVLGNVVVAGGEKVVNPEPAAAGAISERPVS